MNCRHNPKQNEKAITKRRICSDDYNYTHQCFYSHFQNLKRFQLINPCPDGRKKRKEMPKVEWEMFCDEGYYWMFAVRPKGDKDFNSPRLFHFALEADAKQFKELVEKAFILTPAVVRDKKE